jgi:predicted nucleotidyltransferase
MKTLKEIKSTLKANKKRLRADYGVKEIGIFGSLVKGSQSTNSDIDILVEFEKPIGLFGFVRLKFELSDLLGCPVDLVMKTALRPRISRQILSEVVYV